MKDGIKRCKVFYKMRVYKIDKEIYGMFYKNNCHILVFGKIYYKFNYFFKVDNFSASESSFKKLKYNDVWFEDTLIDLMLETTKNKDKLNRVLITEILKTKIPFLNEK